MKKYPVNVIMHVLNEYENQEGNAFLMPKKLFSPVG